MKKNYFYILLSLISITAFAQQPYYNGITTELNTETGMTLFGTLATLTINQHSNSLSYSNIWDACRITDEDPNNSSNVVLIYGWENGSDGDVTNDLSRSKFDNGGNVGDWNREHTFANSLANPDLDNSGTSGPPYADAHNLRSSDVQRNGQRSNHKFITGSGNSNYTGSGWYPGDATTGGTDWRGDVARITMYMYLRYGSQCLPSYNASGVTNAVDADMINLLLDWNAADPVSSIEEARNTYHDGSGSFKQGNRNPFIDNPRLATLIWGGTPAEDIWGIYGGSSDTQAPTIPTSLSVSNETSSAIDLNWTASTDDTAVTGYDIYVDGSYDSSSATNSATVTGLSASTTYSFTVLAKDAANNMSAQSSAVDGTTTAGSSGGSDLFFSEYMEGSSNNKALEVANITGGSIDLSIYSIKLSANGAAGWTTSTYNFPSVSLASDDVFVIANSALAVCTGVVDATSGVTSFNGNDAIGLFKNDILIDILGILGNSSTYASNTTLVRNDNITSPNTTYTPSEWTSFASNTCTDLGSHTAVLSVENIKLSSVKIYPNPVFGNDLTISTSQDLSVEVFNILGKQVLTDEVSTNKTKIDVSSLNTGIYLIRLSSENGSITRKFIKQ